MSFVDQSFADTFTFSRRGPAAILDATGEAATAASHQPRFDHRPTGEARGLLVEGRPDRYHPDQLRVRPGDWATPRGTLLHELETPSGEVLRQAWYCVTDPVSAANASLSIKGWHRLLAYVPVLLPNKGGFVRWRRLDYQLGALIGLGGQDVLAATEDFILQEG